MFKQGSFSKNVAMGYGSRVRGGTRLKEKAKEEAEAKLGAELRATKRELDKKYKEKKQVEKDGETDLNRKRSRLEMQQKTSQMGTRESWQSCGGIWREKEERN